MKRPRVNAAGKRLQASIRSGQRYTIKAIHANAGVERWYRDKLQALIVEMANSMLVHIRPVYRDLDNLIGYAQDARPTNPDRLRRTLQKWGAKWTAKLDEMSKTLAAQFAAKNQAATQVSMRAAFKDAGWTVQFKPTVASVQAYKVIVAENVNLIKSIPDQYLKDVQTAVWDSVMKGADMGTLTKTMQDKYGIAYRRAAFIARDQNNKAKALMENTRRMELGITEAYWQHSGAGKHPREEHVKASKDKLKYLLKKGAYLEGKYVWPGSEPNCRCTSRAIIIGFEE